MSKLFVAEIIDQEPVPYLELNNSLIGKTFKVTAPEYYRFHLKTLYCLGVTTDDFIQLAEKKDAVISDIYLGRTQCRRVRKWVYGFEEEHKPLYIAPGRIGEVINEEIKDGMELELSDLAFVRQLPDRNYYDILPLSKKLPEDFNRKDYETILGIKVTLG